MSSRRHGHSAACLTVCGTCRFAQYSARHTRHVPPSSVLSPKHSDRSETDLLRCLHKSHITGPGSSAVSHRVRLQRHLQPPSVAVCRLQTVSLSLSRPSQWPAAGGPSDRGRVRPETARGRRSAEALSPARRCLVSSPAGRGQQRLTASHTRHTGRHTGVPQLARVVTGRHGSALGSGRRARIGLRGGD